MRSGTTAALIRAEELQRSSLIAAAYALIDLLQHRADKAAARAGAGPAMRRSSSATPIYSADSPLDSSAVHSLTVREQCEALGQWLDDAQRAELRRLIQWLEEARFGPIGKWLNAPTAAELTTACKKLTARSSNSRRGLSRRSSFSSE
ncbi:hypothetical protein [Paenibacillus sp. HB172176]|uniref:hypothetical protein n=1 Tax=Paenibacillus sp. HB172176 TaxID=2493690 RepID=UPI00143964CB|nr:hypothetical protein [Paenibacillus sp. HB172176]